MNTFSSLSLSLFPFFFAVTLSLSLQHASPRGLPRRLQPQRQRRAIAGRGAAGGRRQALAVGAGRRPRGRRAGCPSRRPLRRVAAERRGFGGSSGPWAPRSEHAGERKRKERGERERGGMRNTEKRESPFKDDGTPTKKKKKARPLQPRKLNNDDDKKKTPRQVLVKPSAFEPREWFQKLARLPELATAGPFGGAAGASALSEVFSSAVGAAETTTAASAAAPLAAAASAPRPPVSVPSYSQRTAAALLRLLDLIRDSKGGGGGGGGGSASRFAAADAAAAAAEDDNVVAAGGTTGNNAPPLSSSPLSTIYVITHALSDPAAFAPALRAAAADRVGVSC